MQTKAENLIKALLFTLGLCLIVVGLSRVFERKTSAQMYDAFFEAEENFDVLFLGTSHTSNGVLPLQLWQEQGIGSYNMAGHGNQLATTYWVLVNALDYTDPRVVVLDLSYLSENQKTSLVSVNQTHVSLDAIPFSWNKIRMVNDLFDTAGEKAEFLADFIIYHDRWSELTAEDFHYQPLSYKGAVPGYSVAVPQAAVKLDRSEVCGSDTVGVEYLRKILNLCKARDIDVVLTYLPFPASGDKQREANLGYEIADACEVPYLNFLDMDVVDYDTDCLDADSHLNLSGAVKVTRYLGEYLRENYDLPDRRCDAEYASWQQEADKFAQSISGILLVDQTSPLTSLMLLAEPDIHATLTVSTDQSQWEDIRWLSMIQYASLYHTVIYADGDDFQNFKIDVTDADGNSFGTVCW